MDNSPETVAAIQEGMRAWLHHEVEHAAEHAIGTPTAVNRTVGESMRHIGQMLTIGSAGYLPVRKEEILVAPEPLGETHDAVLLLARQIYAEKDAFLIHAYAKTEGDKRKFTISAFRPDPFHLNQTVFPELPPVIGQELVRQLGKIVRGDGAILVQCVIARNYFPAAPAAEEPVAEAAAPTQQEPSRLPAAIELPTEDTSELL